MNMKLSLTFILIVSGGLCTHQTIYPMKVKKVSFEQQKKLSAQLVHAVIEKKSFIKIQKLVYAGANVNTLSKKSKKTPLLHATEQNNIPLIQFLLDCGALPNSSLQKKEFTPLHYAAQEDNLPLLLLLLNHNANPNSITSKKQKTPLHYAVQNGFTDIVKTLLMYGADPESIDSSYETPLDIAEIFNDQEETDLLLTAQQLYVSNNKIDLVLDKHISDTTRLLFVDILIYTKNLDTLKKVYPNLKNHSKTLCALISSTVMSNPTLLMYYMAHDLVDTDEVRKHYFHCKVQKIFALNAKNMPRTCIKVLNALAEHTTKKKIYNNTAYADVLFFT